MHTCCFLVDGDFQNADNQAEVPVSFRGPTTASTSNDEFPTEHTPLLNGKTDCVKDESKPSEQHGGKTEHVHGRMETTIGDCSYTVDQRSIETPNERKHSPEQSATSSSESSEELFTIDRPNKNLKESHSHGKMQELMQPGEYSVMHIGSSHNIGGVKSFVSNQADPLSVCSENPTSVTVNSSSNKSLIKYTDEFVGLASPDQETQVHKVVYITHYSDSKEWITATLKPILDKLNVEILTVEDAVVGQTIATAHDQLVNKADKVIVIFSLQSKQDKKSLESKWFSYDLDRAKHKNPDPSKISFIPILFGDTKQEDLPKPLDNMIILKADSTNLEEKLKESIFQ